MKLFSYMTAALMLACSLMAQDAESLNKQADTRVQKAIEELSALRSQVAEEKIPLSGKMNTLEQEVISLRKEAERIQSQRDSMSVNLEMLKGEVKTRNEELEYLDNLLAEYTRSLKVRMNVSEFQIYNEKLDAHLDILSSAEAGDAEELDVLSRSIDTGLARAKEIIGGSVFEGKAITGEGNYQSGHFVLVGPVAYFATESGQGGTVANGDDVEPRIDAVNSDAPLAINSVVKSGGGELPFDPTLGNALAIEATKDTFIEHVSKGGIWVFPIIGFAAVSLLLGIVKAFEIFSMKITSFDDVKEAVALLRDKGKQDALHFVHSLSGPGSQMLSQGLESVESDRETLEEILAESVLRVQPKLERLLPFISMTAAISPLLGLLGTVTGMINTFNLITVFGTGDAKTLSSGISEALITTEFGLVVAIPALVLHGILSRRVHGILAKLESQSITFVNSTFFARK